jgi:hypothetical protein
MGGAEIPKGPPQPRPSAMLRQSYRWFINSSVSMNPAIQAKDLERSFVRSQMA